MVVHDPLSGASKPMPDLDSIPSCPLPFAATLHETSSQQKLPRPRRKHDGTPPAFPASAYGFVRQSSCSSHQVINHNNLSTSTSQTALVGSDDWMQARVAYCVDNAKPDLVISDMNLDRLSTKISDLQHLVTLSHFGSPISSPSTPKADGSPSLRSHFSPRTLMSDTAASSARSFSRTISAPASATFFQSLAQRNSSVVLTDLGPLLSSATISDETTQRPNVPPLTEIMDDTVLSESTNIRHDELSSVSLGSISGKRHFLRSKTGAIHLGSPDISGRRAAPDIGIYANGNNLTTLPSALFEISNITVLSFRGNQLQSLPAAIGELRHLKELNISNNKIKFLPSTILNLSLEQFSAHPNSWLTPPDTIYDSTKSNMVSTRVLSPLLHLGTESSVPLLSSLCLKALLSPCPPSSVPPLLDSYAWEAFGGNHPLLDPGILHHLIPCLPIDDLSRILQALRSAAAALSHSSSTSTYRATKRTDSFPRSHLVPLPDDASINPFYYPCPSPRHLNVDATNKQRGPQRCLFLHAAEERFEWMEVSKVHGLPVQWLGCSPGCLAFLEEDQYDEWMLNE